MSSSSESTPSPTILLFARGVLALLDLWPALTIAVAEQWGGPDSSAKKTWLASTIIDEFESNATYLPAEQGGDVDPATANDPPLEVDDLADLINQILSDEFEANVEDGSIDAVTNDIIRLWRDILTPGRTASDVVEALERSVYNAKKVGITATRGAELDELDGDDDDVESGSDDEGDAMDVDEGGVPALVPVTREKEKREEVIDEDGFTLVQGKAKKR